MTNGSSQTIKEKAKHWLAANPALYRTVSAAYRSLNVLQGMVYVMRRAPAIRMGAKPIVVTYGGTSDPRWGSGRPAHPLLSARIDQNRGEFERFIVELGRYRSALE